MCVRTFCLNDLSMTRVVGRKTTEGLWYPCPADVDQNRADRRLWYPKVGCTTRSARSTLGCRRILVESDDNKKMVCCPAQQPSGDDPGAKNPATTALCLDGA